MNTRNGRVVIFSLLALLSLGLWWVGGDPALLVLCACAILLLFLQITLTNIPLTERLVVFRGGRIVGERGPGLTFLLPVVETGIAVDIRPQSQKTEGLSCVTQDSVLLKINVSVLWRVYDARTYVVSAAQNTSAALRALLDGMLREIVAKYPLDSVLTHTSEIRQRLEQEARDKVQDWGIEIRELEIVDEIGMAPEVREAIHREAAAQRESKALRHKAEAEAYALEIYQKVASNIDERALKLRYLTTLETLGAAESTKYIVSMQPSELLRSWKEKPPEEQDERDK